MTRRDHDLGVACGVLIGLTLGCVIWGVAIFAVFLTYR